MTTKVMVRGGADYKALMKRVEQVVATIECDETPLDSVQGLVAKVIERLQGELGLISGRLYERNEEEFVLIGAFPEGEPLSVPRLPATFGPVMAVLERRTIYMRYGDPEFGEEECRVLCGDEFAAIAFGDQRDYLLFFEVIAGHDREELLYSLGIIRHSINQHLRRQHINSVMDQAREIQMSLLPRRMPKYGSFDISGHSIPLELVGGDFFDFVPVSDKILGLTIADASGHGLPAALQVRDIYMGMRMGLSRDFKVVRTFERLNAIINGSRLSSRFVSMVYGELELNGNFVYVNAGHPPPIYIAADGEVSYLQEGGAVIGPLSEATYERGFIRLRPGDCIALYTDGIVETRDAAEEEFGIDRLVETIKNCTDCKAEDMVARIISAAEEFGVGPVQDDRTVVVVRYPAVADG